MLKTKCRINALIATSLAKVLNGNEISWFPKITMNLCILWH